MSYDIAAFEKNLPDPEVIRTAGTALKAKAGSFSSKASSTSSSWAKLQGKGVYSAPGDDVVFSAFGPVTSAASDLVTDVGSVKTATDGFADEVETIKTKLSGIKADAASFESEVGGRSRDDWDDDEGLVKKEQDIIHGLNGLYADLQAAQMTCANSINAIYGGPTYVMVTQDGPKAGQIAYGYTNEQLDAASNEGNIPWGKPTEWDKPWYKDAWDGVCSFGKGVWSGVTGTVKGLWNMVNVTDMDTFKATWTGLGKLALNVAIVSSPVAQVAMRATGHGDVVDKAGQELLAVGKAAIHWDDWKRDPAYAAGATTFDLATILLTAGGGAVAKTGSVAGKIAEISNAGGKVGTVLNATKISSLANVTIKGVDLVSMLKIKGITIATDGIKVAGTKIAELPVKVAGGSSSFSTRVAAMADQLGLGGPRVATAGGGHGLGDVATGGSARPSVMHLGADTPSRPTGTTGAHPGAGSGSRSVPEGEPRFGVRTEDGTPSGKPVTTGTHPDAPEGSTKPAASTTHPDAPESGTAKPAAATTHPDAPESGTAKPATTTHPEAPESRPAAASPETAAGRAPLEDAPMTRHETQLDLGTSDRPAQGGPDGHGEKPGPDDAGEHTAPHEAGEPARPAGPEGYPRPEVQHTVQVPAHDVPGARTGFGRDGGLEPSTAYEVPGRGTFYTNGEGRVHYVETDYGTKGNLNPDLMDPAPDTTYVVGDNHVFQTDGSSRTVLAHVDDLFRGDAYRSSSVTGRVGREGGIGYEGGHLLGKAFGGGTEDINLVAMLRDVNRGSGHSFGNLEGDLRRLLDETPRPTIEVNVRPRFSGDGDVPQLIRAEYRINGGEWQRARFRNV
ncbi:DNA/RNA non-specific endonuclease [Tersicoccus solisilvae]|uniref:DNA/RNA non-specific endonuclease n=1 Tax=Tersicoccus solisilvae TaxID=1882339 RepID=UPI00166F048C|nr:DNA/RNA non-specific endonuclease [Tersicoccus solisilvae]